MPIQLDHRTLGATVLQPGPAHLPRVVPPPRGTAKTVAVAAFSFLTTSAVLGVVLVIVGISAERLAPVDWRPSTIIGAFAGREESARILTAIEAKRAEVAVQQEEAARAQQEVVVVQANNERVTRAYDALYQRGSMLAQQWAEGAKQTLQLNTQAKIEALRGRMDNSATKDRLGMWCDGLDIIIGWGKGQPTGCGDQLRASARNDRDAMQDEIVSEYKAQSVVIARSLNDWAQGIPDPAQLVAYKHEIEKLYPVPRAPVPPAPLEKSPAAGST